MPCFHVFSFLFFFWGGGEGGDEEKHLEDVFASRPF